MQKNWYILYTKPQQEKKVAAVLTKKRVENFIPLVNCEIQKFRKVKVEQKPLFKSYVFVYTTAEQLTALRQIDGVINTLYWLGRPAVITDAEVTSLKEFATGYHTIELEKLAINSGVTERNIYKSSYEIEGNVVAIMNKTIKINLPSLGYALIANVKEEDAFFGTGKRAAVQNYSFAN
jgi:transcription antitermination factor NusG